MVGLVFGVVLEIFEILLPRITSGLKIFFTFHFFPFFLQLGWYWVGFSKFFYLGWDGILFFIALGFEYGGYGCGRFIQFCFRFIQNFLTVFIHYASFSGGLIFNLIQKNNERGTPGHFFPKS